jgi:hypothetical protein
MAGRYIVKLDADVNKEDLPIKSFKAHQHKSGYSHCCPVLMLDTQQFTPCIKGISINNTNKNLNIEIFV